MLSINEEQIKKDKTYEVYGNGLHPMVKPVRLGLTSKVANEQDPRSNVLNEMGTYFATPNEYADRFMAYLTSDEWKVLSYACRRTFGFRTKQDNISISQFVGGAMKYDGSGYRDKGTGLSKSTVTKCLAYLEEVGLMSMVANNDPKINKGALWGLELDYNKVDMRALEERLERRHQANRDRMKKPRASRRDIVII
jgi:hypothetical protein